MRIQFTASRFSSMLRVDGPPERPSNPVAVVLWVVARGCAQGSPLGLELQCPSSPLLLLLGALAGWLVWVYP
jgi:hypothetical protein